MMVLCGDIGGTKTVLQLAECSGGQVNVVDQQRYSSKGFDDFNNIVGAFLGNHRHIKIHGACFGVAGPVIQKASGQSATITNLPWHIDTDVLASQFDIGSVSLINDFEAVGYGLEVLENDDLVILQSVPASPHGNRLVIGAGTGLGVAQLIWTGHQYTVVATESGHCDFAPGTQLQLQLAEYLLARFGRCSMEHVLSGPGLLNIFTFLAAQQNSLESPGFQVIATAADPAAAISEAAQNGVSLALAAMNLFVEVYGTESGNFALCTMPFGGVYIAGGIAAKIINRLQTPAFMEAFRNKGKMSGLMARMPVHIVMNPDVGLLGSRVIALRNSAQ